jgi:putative phosphoribosyl transferase
MNRRANEMSRAVADHIEREVLIPAGDAALAGSVTVPAGANALVLFAHGSGSSRRSPRNVWVASRLQQAGIATLLFDLLTATEEARDSHTREHRFDIALLAQRLADATRWVDAESDFRDFALGYFGASTGSAAALAAATALGDCISAVLSRGGRPDLASDRVLSAVSAPTLLIVGGNDETVIELNERAQALMRCERRLAIVPGASHLFEEPGALEQVAGLAAQWFVEYLVVGKAR